MAFQFTIDVNGDKKVKQRTTHDASFSAPNSASINDKMHRYLLTNCFYGHFLIRMLHTIHIMSFMRPQVRILSTRLDLDAASRRLRMLASMSNMTITLIKNIVYVLL